ncbi:MAG: HypC/HybG/HupF family hydrogenase formation chaperone [Phycisphaeraceae bacterium]|nr:HypC/HybG/HupF family hydrogenase formation chaperone [Phycisphaeraceae bacterium]
MCLAVPARLDLCNDDQTAIADLHGSRIEISTALVPDAIPGDWVLIHAGFAIQKLTQKETDEIWSVLEDLDHG